MRGWTYSILIFALLPGLVRAHDSSGKITLPAPYNETLSAPGQLRKAYQNFAEKTGINAYPVNPKLIQNLLGMPLGDSIKILPIPAVLSTRDYSLLQAGAQLRARTLTAFFADVIFNRARTVTKSGILTEQQIQMIFRTENSSYDLKMLRTIWKGRTAKDINVIYGPDVVRISSGQFRVLEDNVGGLIGGVGDIAATHNAFFSSFGANPELQAPLIGAIETFLADVPKDQWSDKVIFLYRTKKNKEDETGQIKPEDNEDERIQKIADSLNIKVIDANSLKKDSDDFKRLIAGDIKKVINFYSLHEVSGNIVRLALLNAFGEGKFDLFVGPGTDAVGSKAMLPFVDRLSELYLGERAQLVTQPTHWVTSPSDLEGLTSGWVVKKVDGRQGSQVYILDSLNETGVKNLKAHIAEWSAYLLLNENQLWPMFVRQELLDPSYIPSDLNGSWVNFNVDYRPHVFIVNGEPLKPAIWGRASWKIPCVLNNVSQTAMELIVTTPNLCERALMKGATQK